MGLTQAEVAEMAELSDRTYADIERGSVTMRVDSLLKICSALNITPNDILVIDNNLDITEEEFNKRMTDYKNTLTQQFEESHRLEGEIMKQLDSLGFNNVTR